MSIVVKQSFFNLITIGVAFIIGAVNTLYLYPTFLGSKLQGLVIALLAISNIIQPFLSFGTQHAVIRFYSRYRSNKEKNAVLTLSLIIPIIVTAVVIPLFYLYYDQIKVLLFQTENAFSQYAYVIMFIAVSTSFFEMLFCDIIRAVHHDPRTPYRSNRTQYRTDRTENHKNLQTAETSRGWLGFERLLDAIDRLSAIYLLKNVRTNEKLPNRSNRSIRSIDHAIDRTDRRPP